MCEAELVHKQLVRITFLLLLTIGRKNVAIEGKGLESVGTLDEKAAPKREARDQGTCLGPPRANELQRQNGL